MTEEPEAVFTAAGDEWTDGWREGYTTGYRDGVEDGRSQGFADARYRALRAAGYDADVREALAEVMGE